MENPLNTPEMRAEILQLKKNTQSPPINVARIMSFILGQDFKSDSAKLAAEGRKRKAIGPGLTTKHD